MIVAIDGPAASGKSTVAKALAKRLGFNYIDTGAMFRGLTYWALEKGLEREEDLLPLLPSLKISSLEGGLEIDGRKLYQELRSKEVDERVSYYSAMASVRQRLLELQREEAGRSSTVMDGRDIGTAVFPHAEVKVFLTASPEERARRRYLQRSNKMSYDDILLDIKRRDTIDSTRDLAPLVMAQDALLIDSTNMELEEVLERVEAIIRDVSQNS